MRQLELARKCVLRCRSVASQLERCPLAFHKLAVWLRIELLTAHAKSVVDAGGTSAAAAQPYTARPRWASPDRTMATHGAARRSGMHCEQLERGATARGRMTRDCMTCTMPRPDCARPPAARCYTQRRPNLRSTLHCSGDLLCLSPRCCTRVSSRRRWCSQCPRSSAPSGAQCPSAFAGPLRCR